MPLRRRMVTALGVVAVGAMLGVGSAYIAVTRLAAAAPGGGGPWSADRDVGVVDAGPYLRARIAISGLFALSRKEAIYFRADRDDLGRPLTSRCDYEITGRAPAARWWSITAYGADYFLIPNDAGRYSFNSGNISLDGEGAFRILASPAPAVGNWLPTGDAERIYFLLRVYNPPPEIAQAPLSLDLPGIAPVGECS